MHHERRSVELFSINVKAGLHFQSFCSPIKALKVEFISTFRNERKRSRALNIIVQYQAQCDDRFGRRTKRLKWRPAFRVEKILRGSKS